MTHYFRSATLLAATAFLCSAMPASAQERSGPLAQRIQDRVASEVAQREAAARARAEAEAAARMSTMAAQSPAMMAQVRQVQTALNFFAFDAGAVDGLMGPQTRTAIEAYQAYLDYPATGELTEEEGQFLLGAFQRAEADPGTTTSIADAHPDGIMGVLLVFQDAMAVKETGEVPSFMETLGTNDRQCPVPLTQSGGAQSSDASAIITSQYCAARDVVVAHSVAMIAGIETLSAEQVRQQCLDFEPSLARLVDALPTSAPRELIDETASFVDRTGQSPEAMSGIATTCLGVGYDAARLQLSMGSALILTALDQRSFAEFPGYHLALGLGTEQSRDLARAWFEIAVDSDDAHERTDSLRSTLTELSALPDASPGTDGIFVPTFNTQQED